MMNSSLVVKQLSECYIKPWHNVPESKRRYYLGPLDLKLLSYHYSQVGLLYHKPEAAGVHLKTLLQSLKNSLSMTLDHFYPLAGQLATEIDEDRHECLIFVDCHKGPGAKFIHASADVTISNILTPVHVPDELVNPLFDHHETVNHDGHSKALLSVQVTELLDGVFIGCSLNHVLADGTSFWNFWNVWSETHRAMSSSTQNLPYRPPINNGRWSPEGYGRAITLPFTHSHEFVNRHGEEGLNRTRVFHFSFESLTRLKSKARSMSNRNISTMQALTALFWRAYVRANRLPHNDDLTNCIVVANDRHRLNPPLSPDYFGNFIIVINNKIKVSDLVDNNLGWAASLLNNSVANHDDKAVREYFQQWLESPFVVQPSGSFNRNNLMLMNSPLFDVYGNDFGFGRPLAVRSGSNSKFGGVVLAYQGREGGGSIDLEICMPPESMTGLELDPEFMSVVSAAVTPSFRVSTVTSPPIVSKM